MPDQNSTENVNELPDSDPSSAADGDISVIDRIPASGEFAGGAFAEIMDATHDTHPVFDDEGSARLETYAEHAFLEYAMSVVKGRALPDVADGQKPVQRRILYSMHRMGLSNTSKHIKSARVVGECMGKYHPHGDGSIYDAMVLSSQDFSRRYPLVDGQGNFGSRDGDGAAAMRYTEARLTAYAELLLAELDMGTVDFVANYDGSLQEPAVLPARLPMMLLNGASGIAVGYACEIPSHNLREIAAAAACLIRNPEATLDELMELVPAPDFPGGGQLIASPAAIRDAYAGGRGSLRMRARWRREDLARGQWRIVVYELPHGVSTAKVLSEIEAATNPQPGKGKKDITQEQKNVKALLLGLLDGARDESDKSQPVRLVIEPKTSRISEEELMGALLVHTSLESNVPMNMVVIGPDGNPSLNGLRQMLADWVGHRYTTVERRTRHRLDQVQHRLHILEGRMAAFLRIEEVIRIIRESDDPKLALMEKIGLTDVQAEDILEIRLRQLARLEGIKIEREAAELREEEKKLLHLLADRAAMTAQILLEIEADAKKYGDDRRTLVEPVESTISRNVEISVADEPITLLVSANGWLRARVGHGIDRSTIAWKQSDHELAIVETRTTQPLIVIDTKGRAYAVRTHLVPTGRGDGIPISSMIDLQAGAKIAHVLSGDPADSYFFANSASYGFITQLRELDTRQKAGKAFMTLEASESVLPPVKIADMNDWIVACSHGPKESRMVLFPAHEMKVMPKGRGVIVQVLESGEKLVLIDVLRSNPPASVRVKTDGGQAVAIKGEDLKKFLLHRARKGCQLSKRAKPVSVTL